MHNRFHHSLLCQHEYSSYYLELSSSRGIGLAIIKIHSCLCRHESYASDQDQTSSWIIIHRRSYHQKRWIMCEWKCHHCQLQTITTFWSGKSHKWHAFPSPSMDTMARAFAVYHSQSLKKEHYFSLFLLSYVWKQAPLDVRCALLHISARKAIKSGKMEIARR